MAGAAFPARPGPTAGLLALAEVLLWAADHRPEDVEAVGAREAAVAGLAQVLALAPGVSRSGANSRPDEHAAR